MFFKKQQQQTEQPKKRTIDRIKKRFNGYVSALTSNLTGDWTTTEGAADQIIAKGLQTVRARSRDQYFNNEYAKRFVSMVKVNVVGDRGITVQSKVIDPRGNADKVAQKAIETAWLEWSEDKELCDVHKRKTFKEIQQLVAGTLVIDGECFVYMDNLGASGFSLKVIDPARIDVQLNKKLSNGNFIRFGIEYNSNGVVVAYHYIPERMDVSPLGQTYTTKEYKRLNANKVLHIYIEELVDQRRGFPWMATALYKMKMLNGYAEASLVAARIGAAKMGFFTSASGDEYHGEAGADGYTTHVEAGQFEQLPDGLKFESFDPTYPAGEFQTFSKHILRGMSSGLGVSYNTLANDLEGVNFSSMRHGAVEEREYWKATQELLISQFVKPVFRAWLKSQYALNNIVIYNKSGQALPLKNPVQTYLPATFQGKRWAWVDPLKDIQAKREEYNLNVISLSSIIREKGQDPEVVFEEIRQEREILKQYGIAPQEAGLSVLGEEENEPE